MKYYSEVTKKLYASEAELVEAEKRFEEEKLQKEEAAIKVSNEKKKAATRVELATKAYDKASEDFELKKKELMKILDDAEEKAAEIINAANEEVEKKLAEAKESLRSAKVEKVKAIEDFNKSYGPYKTVLTGEDAKKEIRNFVNDFNNFDRWLSKLYKVF